LSFQDPLTSCGARERGREVIIPIFLVTKREGVLLALYLIQVKEGGGGEGYLMIIQSGGINLEEREEGKRRRMDRRPSWRV
jgi:hypothetical protein